MARRAGRAVLLAAVLVLSVVVGSVALAGSAAAVNGPGDITDNGDAAADPDGDGLYEDLNGDGEIDNRDLLILFNNRSTLSADHVDFFADGNVDTRDVLQLWIEHIEEGPP